MSDPSSPKRFPRLLQFYTHYIEDQDMPRFLRYVSECYEVASLERLTKNSAKLIRRAAVLALGHLGDYQSNAVMGMALNDSDRSVRLAADAGIRRLWRRVGSKAEQQQLATIAGLNSKHLFEDALRKATRLIDTAPYFAEAWNQRAVAYFGLNRFDESIQNARQTLELNPYHFGAASGMGQCFLELNDAWSALESFRRALQLNPDMEYIRAQVARLQRILEGT